MGLFSGLFGQRYVTEMRPVFNKRALFSDTTPNYIQPAEPEKNQKVKIRFRTGRNNVDRVYLVHDGVEAAMRKVLTETVFDYYEIEVQLYERKFTYCFKVEVGALSLYYNRKGDSKEYNENPLFMIIPGFHTPHWAKNCIMYQIYTDRFYNGDPNNDVLDMEYYYLGGYSTRVPKDQWDKYPDAMGVREFYGGDLQGVLDKMDYLQGLGVDVIYFNPLFVSPSNHKYDIQDYDNIDPHFGPMPFDEGELLEWGKDNNAAATRYINRVTDKRNLDAANQLFAKVIEEAHKRGMKVIMDGVFNHCGSFNKWMDKERIYENAEGYEKGAYITADSPYRDYFIFKDMTKWPYNDSYEGWWDYDTLPKLHYEGAPKLFEYILHIGEKWVSAPYYADGWRLDVAADLGLSPEMNHHFWKEFRKRVKAANPNAIILAEHYGDPSAWLQGDEWDTIMNYDAFMEPVTWFLTGMEKHSDEYRADLVGNADAFWESMAYNVAKIPGNALWVSMNELSNHDHSRFLTRTSHKVGRTEKLGPEAANEGIDKAVMRQAVVMQMCWPGAATIYYGDEAGVCGFTDPDNRRTYPWGREDMKLIEFHRKVIQIHKTREEFKKGSLKKMGSEKDYLAFGRFTKHSCSVILINTSEDTKNVTVPVWVLGVPKEAYMKRLLLSDAAGLREQYMDYEVHGGKIMVTLPPKAAEIIGYQK